MDSEPKKEGRRASEAIHGVIGGVRWTETGYQLQVNVTFQDLKHLNRIGAIGNAVILWPESK